METLNTNTMGMLYNDAHTYTAIWVTVLDINKRTQFAEVHLVTAVTEYRVTYHALKMTHNLAIMGMNSY
jgi:hypothetical protein